MASLVSVSIVSHGQANLVLELLKDLDQWCANENLEVLLVLNTPEVLPFKLSDFLYSIKIIKNEMPKGFAENHNAAFAQSAGDFFCVLNPDIRLGQSLFSPLLPMLDDHSVGLIAPLVVSPEGSVEDSARTFPTPLTILCKVLGGCLGSSYVIDRLPVFPDWVGGMAMLFPRTVFQEIGGFDQRYFLYYEDVDLCARLRLRGYQVMLSPQVCVTHHAQRTSRRKLRYLSWHLRSMLRFFLSPVFWQVQWQKARKALK